MSRHSSSEISSHPNPTDFVLYIPWACLSLRLNYYVEVERATQVEYVSQEKQKKPSKSIPHSSKTNVKDDGSESAAKLFKDSINNVVYIIALYDVANNLVQIKFLNNPCILRPIIKLIGLVAPFHPHLSGITINRGLNQGIIYELARFVTTTNITEVCLDGTFVKEGNHHIILNSPNKIKHLSLSRCKINDVVLQNLISTMTFRQPSSNTLCILNLSSNKITDLGASYIADMLKTNRQLLYLNIADNVITDKGACKILDALIHFSLTVEEILEQRQRLFEKLKKKAKLIEQMRADQRSGEVEKKDKKKELKSTSKKIKGAESSTAKSANDDITIDKEHDLGETNDPYSTEHLFTKDNLVYCYGNNILCYLNMAFNDLTYTSVVMLLKVVKEQKQNGLNGRKPMGLMRVNLDGNNVPVNCSELVEIDHLLDLGVTTSKPVGKSTKR